MGDSLSEDSLLAQLLLAAAPRPAAVRFRVGALDRFVQERLGTVGTLPSQWSELPPFHLIIGDEEVLDLIQVLPAYLVEAVVLGRVIPGLDDGLRR